MVKDHIDAAALDGLLADATVISGISGDFATATFERLSGEMVRVLVRAKDRPLVDGYAPTYAGAMKDAHDKLRNDLSRLHACLTARLGLT